MGTNFQFLLSFTSLTISHIKGPQTFILQSVGHLSNFYIMPGTFRNHVEFCVWIIANFLLISRVELQKMFKRDKAILLGGMLNISEIVMPEYFRNGYVGISPK